MPNGKKNTGKKTGLLSVEETNAMLAKELADDALKEQGSPPKSAAPKAPEEPHPKAVSEEDQVGSSASTGLGLGSDGRPLREPEGSIFPTDSHESDETAKKLLTSLEREMNSRFQDPSQLLDDLKELGMVGDFSHDLRHISLPFEDVHRLVTTMRMAELILNERVQTRRKAKMAKIKAQLDEAHCPNMSALLVELEKAKQSLTQKHSFHSIGAFEASSHDFEGDILLETMMIARAVSWLAHLSVDPNLETRRGTLSVFSELRAAYSSQQTLHELCFHHHDEKRLLEERVRGAMREFEERLAKVAVGPAGSVHAKRQKVAAELKTYSNLVEEMLSITGESYGASLAAAQMGHLAFEHTVTITDLRSWIAELQTEICSWVRRSSEDATAAMILAEENVVLARANSELLKHMTRLNGRQRKQTEFLEALLANSNFGL